MRKIGAREAALLLVAAAAWIGATHVAPAAAHFGAGAHHGGSAARAAGNSSRMGAPHGRLPPGTAARSSAAGRTASLSLSRPTSHAERLGEHSSARSFRGRASTAAGAVHGHERATLAKHLDRNAPDLRRHTAGPAYIRPRYHGGFTGWSGPLFWPHAYDDIFDYTFWPYDFDQTFWAYAYADVYNSIVWPYGDSVGSIGVSGGPPRLTRSRADTSAGLSREITQLCGDRTPGLTDWPIQRIEQTVVPTQAQQAALLELKTASARAIEVLHAACPIDAVATPLARLDAMEKRLDAMLQAVGIVRPALESFYGSLRDEQKARFNAIGYAGNAPQRKTSPEHPGERRSATHFCNSDHGAALSQQSIGRIEQAVHPTLSQRGALDDLRRASTEAIARLRSACPTFIPATPLARLDVLEKRLDAMAQAVKTIRPAMQHFYDSLDAEQRAVFDAIGWRENAVGSREATSGEAR